MFSNFPFTSSKDGAHHPNLNSRSNFRSWVPTLVFARKHMVGMSGVFLAACGQQSFEVPAMPEAPKVVRDATPPLPPMPKSLTLEDIDFNDYSKSLAKFTGLKEGQSRGEAVDNVRLHFAPENGSAMISTSQSTFEREDGAVLIFSASGLADDSVKAEEIYLIVSGAKGSQTLAAYGSRIKCHRGKNTTEWQTALCP